MRKFLFFLSVVLLAGAGVFYYWNKEVYRSVGTAGGKVTFEIPPGTGAKEAARILRERKLISSEAAFLYYLYRENLSSRIKSGRYAVFSPLTVPELADVLIGGKSLRRDIKVTFPEGWSLEQMARRLTARGFDGEAFRRLAEKPTPELLRRFEFLRDLPAGASLQGYLYPDTYFFLPETTAEEIIVKMLTNFDRKLSPTVREEITRRGESLHEVVTLASIIEGEVHKPEERPTVSGIFHNRLRVGMPLQSDVTLKYVLGQTKIKYSKAETEVDSPYNTYRYPGLPPGPVNNPSRTSIEAAVFPEKTEYMYFLNNAETGQTVFSRTFPEHVRAKAANGL